MTAIATKFQTGAAACAIAVAAALTPTPVAHADPVMPVPTALGASAECELAGGPGCETETASIGAASLAPFIGPPPNILQNGFWWFGPANPAPPPDTTDFFTFNPLPLIPGFFRPLWGFFTQNLNFEACVLGLSVKVGPYGTVTGSIGSSC
jgi:hypothetical protein